MMHGGCWTIAVLGAVLAVSACAADVAPGKNGENVGVARAALNDPFWTGYGAQTAVATTDDGIMAVWQGNDGSPQIVGEAFNQSDGSPRLNPGQGQVYSMGPKPKSSPAVASETVNFNHYLIVWQEDFSSTDSDIMGQVVSDNGTIVTGVFGIETDGFPEKVPAVALIPDIDQWLVTYTRTVGSTTSLMARRVDNFGNPSAPVTLVPSGVQQTQGRNSISSCSGTNEVMLTWNDNLVAFADVATLTTGPRSFISNAAGLVGACNPFVGQHGQYAVTWRQGSNTAAKVGVQVFPEQCTSLSCATPPNYVVTAGSAGVTALNLPVIAPFGFDFGISVGVLPSSLQRLAFSDVDSGGNLNATVPTIVPSCGGSINGSLGYPGTLSASASDSNPSLREFFIYDPHCTAAHKVRSVGVNPWDNQDILSFDISD